ncbi:Uncharacterized protein QTN25_004067 [Entamoeba marina]
MSVTSTLDKGISLSMKELKRCSKSYEAIQQAVVLGLLNMSGFGFRVRRPERRSQKTLQLMIIEELLCGNVVVDFDKELNKRCSDYVDRELKEANYKDLSMANVESMSAISKVAKTSKDLEKLKQIKRHKDANKAALSFNELIEKANSLGYYFKKRSTKPAKLTLKMMKISSVSGNIKLDVPSINHIGKSINLNVFNRFGKENSSVLVPAKDPEIITIFEGMTHSTNDVSTIQKGNSTDISIENYDADRTIKDSSNSNDKTTNNQKETSDNCSIVNGDNVQSINEFNGNTQQTKGDCNINESFDIETKNNTNLCVENVQQQPQENFVNIESNFPIERFDKSIVLDTSIQLPPLSVLDCGNVDSNFNQQVIYQNYIDYPSYSNTNQDYFEPFLNFTVTDDKNSMDLIDYEETYINDSLPRYY